MKYFFPIFFFISTATFAQSADFIILKKNDKTIQTFYSGTNISFVAVSGANISALINQIKDDTLYLQQFVIRYLPTTFGTYIIDTAGSYHYKYHYNQIKIIGKTGKRGFSWNESGAALLGGGILLTVGSGIVYIADRNKFSAPLLIAAVALGTAGYFMTQVKNNGMKIGKKYKLVYMNMSNKKN